MRTANISSLTSTTTSLQVLWDDGVTSGYPWIWLRDHDHHPDALHPVTQQRQLSSASLSTEIGNAGISLERGQIVVSWQDGGRDSVLPVPFLARFRTPVSADVGLHTVARRWDASTIRDPMPSVDYQAVMDSDEGVAHWLALVAEHGFCIALGTPTNASATEALLRRIAYVRETIFGGMWEFNADLTRADTAYTNLELRPHTDGTYSHDAPGVQLLHCLHFDGTGGESILVDGFNIAGRMRREHPDHFAILTEIEVPGQYIGDGAHLMAARPILRLDGRGELVQVSFNNYDRAPFLLAESDMISFYEAIRTFEELANSAPMQWRHVLAPGEALLFDNWRVLHGRGSYTGVRQMCGAYVNREDVDSRLRQLVVR